MKEIKFDKILLCVDNSGTSAISSRMTLDLAGAFGSRVVGMHVYNAVMHEGAFRIMEPTLPEKYQTEEILQQQRSAHNTLISTGLEKISLSYISPLEDMFWSSNIDFRARVKEGKNFKELINIANEEEGDLIIIGDKGFSDDSYGFIGSVCNRVLRNLNMDIIIVKRQFNSDRPKYVVALDGSPSAIRSLRIASKLAKKYSAELHLIYVFDSKLHREIFQKLKDSVINSSDGYSFNSQEQEKLHDLFIDKGLMKVGEMILSKAVKEALNGNNNVSKTVSEGIPFKAICDHASSIGADFIFMGRTGRHYTDGIDIGSTAENAVRFSPCSVCIARHEEFRGWEL